MKGLSILFIVLLLVPSVLGGLQVEGGSINTAIIDEQLKESEERIKGYMQDESKKCIDHVNTQAEAYAEDKIGDLRKLFFYEKVLTFIGVYFALICGAAHLKIVMLIKKFREEHGGSKK